jgi:serine protease AprX
VLRHPTGGFGYVVCADAAVLERIRALACVRWAGHLPHADRVAPAITGTAPAVLPRRRSLAGALTVDVFDAADLPRIARRPGAGLQRGDHRQAGRRISLLATGTAAQVRQQVQALSAVHGVRWIGERVLPRTSNNVAAGLIGQPFAARPAAPGLGLTGAGETVAVCDTGLDTGDPANIHPDFAGRVVAVKQLPHHAVLDTLGAEPRW